MLPSKSNIMPNFIEISETILEKTVTNFFKPFNILAFQGAPWAKNHRSGWWSTSTPSSYLQNFVPFEDPSLRYLLPNFIHFVAGVIPRIQLIVAACNVICLFCNLSVITVIDCRLYSVHWCVLYEETETTRWPATRCPTRCVGSAACIVTV